MRAATLSFDTLHIVPYTYEFVRGLFPCLCRSMVSHPKVLGKRVWGTAEMGRQPRKAE